MTAEIAVMNEEAVALAADSAVTGPKVFTSANKIFALSKYHPVGVMVYDSAQFLGVPWETIIKDYRSRLRTRSFATLQEQADHFLAFFNRRNSLFPAASQRRAVEWLAVRIFTEIRDAAIERLQRRIEDGESPTDKDIKDEFQAAIDGRHQEWTGLPYVVSMASGHRRTVANRYRAEINRAMGDVFQQLPLSSKGKRQLRELVTRMLTSDKRYRESPGHSGIVIAGFGRAEVFPRLHAFHFEAIAAGQLKYTKREPITIGPDNRAGIVPFAQTDEVHTFISGVDPGIQGYVDGWWRRTMDELVDEVAKDLKLSQRRRDNLLKRFASRCDTFVDEYESDLGKIQSAHYVWPVLKVLAMLPKDELAAMAESLVNLTSFKRRVSAEKETVGGPIDVAVISRGDGFIWIKRKHYFTRELNPQFFANYYREDR
jgi:hypothetical protein